VLLLSLEGDSGSQRWSATMAASNHRPNRSIRTILYALAVAAGVGVLLAASGFAYAASQETHDTFCASCHTEPESTFVERSKSTTAVDLASYHTPQQTRCIDCHSGPGVLGRMGAELMGARNAAAWYTGMATQPAPLTFPIQDVNCLKCHQDVTQPGYAVSNPLDLFASERGGEEEGGSNHWHEQLSRWRAASAVAITCTDCHPGHTNQGSAATGFQITQQTRGVCEACHQVLGEGREV
jgi:nitrate/TMAO reductase-like tetraheme cytochrome c subunit